MFLGERAGHHRHREDANLGKKEGHRREEDAPAFLGAEVGHRREEEARSDGKEEPRSDGKEEALSPGKEEARSSVEAVRRRCASVASSRQQPSAVEGSGRRPSIHSRGVANPPMCAPWA